MEPTKTYFISGHLDLTQEEFDTYYEPLIKRAIDGQNRAFVVGDARGADFMAQCLLKSLKIEKVTIYHMFEHPRNNAGYPTKGGYESNNAKDSAMTRESDVDIAWVRPGRENSGTARNLKRRKLRMKTCTHNI